MLFPSDTHQPDKDPPPPPPHLPPPPPPLPHPLPTSNTPHSDSGFSFSSSSSSEIMGTPFDLGAQRFEYPFPQAQGSPTDSFLPLSSTITPHSHAQLPPWQIHISKSFPLTPPPLGKFKAHPKLRPPNAREPPVPPGLVKRRSRIPGLQHQSSEEPSDKSDVSDDLVRARLSLTNPPPRHTPAKQQPVPLSVASCDRPSATVQDPAALPQVVLPPRPPQVVSASASNASRAT